MSNADKTLICKKGKLAKNNATRQLIRNKLVTSGSTIKGTAPMRAPGGKKGSHACTQFKGMNFSHVFDDTFSSSSSGAISDSNLKMGMFLRKSPYFPTSHSNDTCPMDVSTNGDSQKGPESGRFVTKTAPVGDSVGAGEIILFDAEDMFDMQQTPTPMTSMKRALERLRNSSTRPLLWRPTRSHFSHRRRRPPQC